MIHFKKNTGITRQLSFYPIDILAGIFISLLIVVASTIYESWKEDNLNLFLNFMRN